MTAYSALASVYDQLTADVDYSRFADFYEELFRLEGLSPVTVLDLACGTGSLTLELAKRGYELIGTDASEDMLAEAQQKTAEAGCAVRPLLLNQRMEELDLYGTVDAALCSLDGLNYLAPELLAVVFHRLWLFTEPGGILIFDVNTPEKLKDHDGQAFIDETEDVYCVWRAEFDEAENACFYGMDIFSRAGEQWTRAFEEHIEYAHSAERLKAELAAAGFESIRLYGELKTSPPGENEQRIFFTARKPKTGQ